MSDPLENVEKAVTELHLNELRELSVWFADLRPERLRGTNWR